MPTMDTSATDTAARESMPIPPNACFWSVEHWLESKSAAIVLALSLSLLVTGIDASNYLLYCLVSGKTATFTHIAQFFPLFPTVVYLIICCSIPGRLVKDYRIADDRLVVTTSRVSKEYALQQLAEVMLYEYKGKPALIQLEFQGQTRLMVDRLIDMPQFVESLLASIPGYTVVERKPHLGKHYTDKFVVLGLLIFVAAGAMRDVLPVPALALFIVSFVLLVALFFLARVWNPSIVRTRLSLPMNG